MHQILIMIHGQFAKFLVLCYLVESIEALSAVVSNWLCEPAPSHDPSFHGVVSSGLRSITFIVHSKYIKYKDNTKKCRHLFPSRFGKVALLFIVWLRLETVECVAAIVKIKYKDDKNADTYFHCGP